MAHNSQVVHAIEVKRKSLLAASFGNVLEWYEWGVYGAFAPFIAAVMFNPDDPVSALLSTFAVFAAGFLMRPLGGIVFGRIADRAGRKKVLITTLLLMGGASFAVGAMPTYASIGAWASLLLLIARLVQGFAHGGESAASYSYVAEIAPPQRRGLWSSAVFAAVLGGTIAATLAGFGLTKSLGESAVVEWAWRIPFLVGGVLAILVLFLRRGMEESEVFTEQAPHTSDDHKELADADSASAPRSKMLRPMLLAIALVCGLTVFQYTWLSYVSTNAIVSKGMKASDAYLAMVAAQIIALITLPLWGRLSDRVGRRPMFIAFGILVVVLQFPLMNMITADPWTLFVASTVALILAASTGALQSATLSEFFHTGKRTLGIGFAFSLSVAIFGGTAPYLNQWLYSHDLQWGANVYVLAAAVVTALAAWFMPETKGIDLGNIGTEQNATNPLVEKSRRHAGA